ncbi:hypothetical protein QYF36_022676 [Acer negundo]|nr:hypothetical protein QYF36_022676 [Acer negundo]
MLTIGIWIPFYDRVLVPALRKVTKHEGKITLLQRIIIGIVFSILSVIVAGFVEKERKDAANLNPQVHMSVMWLAWGSMRHKYTWTDRIFQHSITESHEKYRQFSSAYHRCICKLPQQLISGKGGP